MKIDDSPTAHDSICSEGTRSSSDLARFLKTETGQKLIERFIRDPEDKSKEFSAGHSIVFIGRMRDSSESGVKCVVRFGLRPISDDVLAVARNHPSSFVHVVDQKKVTATEAEWLDGVDFFVQIMVQLRYSLEEKLKRNPIWAPSETRGIAIGVAKALSILHQDDNHEYSHCHRDIKPANLLLDDAGHIYVGDLDLAAKNTKGEVSRQNASVGTSGYKAPELEKPSGRYSKKTDIYALGVTLSRLITGHKNPQDAVKQVKVMNPDGYSDPRLLEIVKTCIESAPEKRPSASKIVADLGIPKDLIKTRWPKKELAWTGGVVVALLATIVGWNIKLQYQLKTSSHEIDRREDHLVAMIQSVRSSLELASENVEVLEQLCDYAPDTLLDDETAAAILRSAIRYKQDAKYEQAIEHLEWLDKNLNQRQVSIQAQALHEIAAIAFYSGVPSKSIPNPMDPSQIESVFKKSVQCWELTLDLPSDSASADTLRKTFRDSFPGIANAKEVTKLLSPENANPLHAKMFNVALSHKDSWHGLAKTWGYLGDLYRTGSSEQRFCALTLYAVSASVRQSIARMEDLASQERTKQIAELSNTIEVCRALENLVIWTWLDFEGVLGPEDARELYDSYLEIVRKLQNAIPKEIDSRDLGARLVFDRALSDYSHYFLQACLLVPQVQEECLDLRFHEDAIARISSPQQRECLQLQRAAMRVLGIYPKELGLNDASVAKDPSLTEIQNRLAEKALLYLEKDGVIGWGTALAIETWMLCEFQLKMGNIRISDIAGRVKPMSAATTYKRIIKISALREKHAE